MAALLLRTLHLCVATLPYIENVFRVFAMCSLDRVRCPLLPNIASVGTSLSLCVPLVFLSLRGLESLLFKSRQFLYTLSIGAFVLESVCI